MTDSLQPIVSIVDPGGNRPESSPLAYRTLSVSHRAGSLVRLELQLTDSSASRDQPPMMVDIDMSVLRASLDATDDATGVVYEFNQCRLDTGRRLLTRGECEIHLRPKVYRLLVHLLENRSRAVSRDELCEAVWDGRCVGNATVDSTVKAVRHAVGDDGVAQRVVQTISGYGYRLVAAVDLVWPDDTISCASTTVVPLDVHDMSGSAANAQAGSELAMTA